MRDFGKHQRELFNRADRNPGKCSQERGGSGTKGVVSSERPTLGDGREIAYLTLDDAFDGPSYFRQNSWVAKGPQQFLKVSARSADKDADVRKPCRGRGVALAHQFDHRFGFFLQPAFYSG